MSGPGRHAFAASLRAGEGGNDSESVSNRLVLPLVAAVGLHARTAILRSSGLLEHDESIALLTAAGKSKSAEQFYERENDIRVYLAADLQALLKPTGTGWRDVIASLQSFDIHPPLYFSVLHTLQRLGIDSQASLRLFGSMVALLCVWCANRFVWPDASALGKLLGSAWLMATPACVEIATELRQYSLVYLGTIISMAALLRAWSLAQCDRRAAWLLAAAPILLLYSQFGTIIWIAVGFVAVLPGLISSGDQFRRILLTPTVLVVLLLAPLLLWWYMAAGSVGPAPVIGFSKAASQVLEPIGTGLGQAWLSWPGRWASLRPDLYMAIAIPVVVGLLAWQRRSPGDLVLLVAMIVWAIVWTGLLMAGKIPPHAVTTKYLAPLVLALLVILVRATRLGPLPWIRRTALLALGASLLTHTLGVVQLWQRSSSEPLVRELAGADAMLINSPRRGYLLPLAAAMKPDAKIIVATPDAVLAQWDELQQVLPTGDIMLVEVFQERDGPALEFFDRLRQMYGAAEPLRSERARVITKFSRPAVSGAK